MATPSCITNCRQLLTRAGALALTGNATPDTYLMPGPGPAYLLYLHAVETEVAVNNFSGDEEGDEYRNPFDTYIAAERKLATTPTSSLMGICGKMKRLADDQCWTSDDSCLESCSGLSVLADLNRMAAATTPYWAGEVPWLGRQSLKSP